MSSNVATEQRSPGSQDEQAAPVRRVDTLVAHGGRFALLFVLLVMVIVFGAMKPDTFLTTDNLKSILTNETGTLFLAFAAMMPLIVGQFDLSIASVFTFAQVMVVGLPVQHHTAVILAIAVAIGGALIVGLLNGLLVVRGGISSFIVTLASGSIVSGVTLWYSKGQSIFGEVPPGLTNIARTQLFGIALPVYYALATAIILFFILSRLPLGRKMYAIGSNERAAALSGVATERYVIGSFMASSLLAGIGGILLGSSVGAATSESGATLLIPAFAGAFLGATMQAGRFNPFGTVVAVYVVAVLINGLQQLGASLWVTPFLQGATLILAIGLSAWTVRLRQRLARAARLKALDADAKRDAGGPAAVSPT